jgi:acetyl-CoA acyltransferase
MGVGPVKAVPKLMDRTGLSLEDMDVIELNEAFASQALVCARELNLAPEKLNPRGGAIALGHPLGATGAILTCKAISYLEDHQKRYALIAMCVGGGMGAACIIERIAH